MTEAPEHKRIAVFNRGTPSGLKGCTPDGGQEDPISIDGDKLL